MQHYFRLVLLGLTLPYLVPGLATSVVLAGERITFPQQLYVYNGMGKRLGPVLSVPEYSSNGDVLMPMRIGHYGFVLVVTTTGASGNATSGVVYRSIDCSGTPWFYPTDGLLPTVWIDAPGKTIYLQDPQGQREIVQQNEPLTALAHDGTCYPTGFSEDVPLVPALALGDASAVLVPPFAVR